MTPAALRLEQLLDDLQQNVFPQHIDELPVKDKFKRAFTLFERVPCSQPGGLFAALNKENGAAFKELDYKKRQALMRTMLTHSWWPVFFGPFYYLVTGLWRKGLVLLGVLLLFSFALGVFLAALGIEPSRSMDIGIAVGLGYMVSMIATYDLYRLKVKKEVFWW